MNTTYEICPGCEAQLPASDGATHRYVGASPACWAIYAALNNAGEPPLASDPVVGLLIDAYMVQHPGTSSPQAIQSVAVHGLVLYGVFEREVDPANALWIRRRALREGKGGRSGRFQWLIPPSFAGILTVADIVKAPTPQDRTHLLQQYVSQVWQTWAQNHVTTFATWYDQFVIPDHF
jgi:hypothetical protein